MELTALEIKFLMVNYLPVNTNNWITLLQLFWVGSIVIFYSVDYDIVTGTAEQGEAGGHVLSPPPNIF